MDDRPYFRPAALDQLLADAAGLGFAMSCEDRTGSLLATLAASKPGGHVVELGTGVGAGASWLLHGMRADAHLTSVETDPAYQAVAAAHLAQRPPGTRRRLPRTSARAVQHAWNCRDMGIRASHRNPYLTVYRE